MQQALCATVRAGVDWRDVHLQAHELTAEVLRDADIIRCSPAQAVATRLTSVFLPHGIGHLLGLEVHDVGGFMRAAEGGDIPHPAGHPFLRLTRVLEPGFVVTMEPGIYFIDQLLEAARSAELRPRHQLVAGRGAAQVRRHPHRGRPRGDPRGLREPDARGVRRALGRALQNGGRMPHLPSLSW